MQKWLWGFVGVVLLLAAVGGWAYLETGLKEYLQVEWQINKMSGDEREAARRQFAKDSNTIFDAILGPISANKKRLWLWAGGLPRRYEIGKEAIFTFYDVCQAAMRGNDQKRETFTFAVDDSVRMITQDISEWEKWVTKGSYVQVKIDTADSGKKLIEAHAYRWPLFLPFRLEELCAEEWR